MAALTRLLANEVVAVDSKQQCRAPSQCKPLPYLSVFTNAWPTTCRRGGFLPRTSRVPGVRSEQPSSWLRHYSQQLRDLKYPLTGT